MTAADVSESDVDLILLILALLCLVGAAYMAYMRNVLAVGLLILVAVVCFVLT